MLEGGREGGKEHNWEEPVFAASRHSIPENESCDSVDE